MFYVQHFVEEDVAEDEFGHLWGIYGSADEDHVLVEVVTPEQGPGLSGGPGEFGSVELLAEVLLVDLVEQGLQIVELALWACGSSPSASLGSCTPSPFDHRLAHCVPSVGSVLLRVDFLPVDLGQQDCGERFEYIRRGVGKQVADSYAERSVFQRCTVIGTH